MEPNRSTRVLAHVSAAMLLVVGVLLPFGAQASAANTVSQTFSYTGSTQTFTVPDGVSALTVTLTGGQGGRGGGDSQGSPTPGGYRGVVTGTIDVTPGQQLTLAVGGGGGTGVSSSGSAAGGSAGLNPLSGYDGAVGGVAGPAGSSGGGGGSGAATVLRCRVHRPGRRRCGRQRRQRAVPGNRRTAGRGEPPAAARRDVDDRPCGHEHRTRVQPGVQVRRWRLGCRRRRQPGRRAGRHPVRRGQCNGVLRLRRLPRLQLDRRHGRAEHVLRVLHRQLGQRFDHHLLRRRGTRRATLGEWHPHVRPGRPDLARPHHQRIRTDHRLRSRVRNLAQWHLHDLRRRCLDSAVRVCHRSHQRNDLLVPDRCSERGGHGAGLCSDAAGRHGERRARGAFDRFGHTARRRVCWCR
ncbi:MAG: hypothetical protein V9E94_11985 [Microthrixaceae bacterium]